MENMRMHELKALMRECRLRGYSRLRKAKLIAFFQETNIRPKDDRDLHRHPHRCLLGNHSGNHKSKSDNPN